MVRGEKVYGMMRSPHRKPMHNHPEHGDQRVPARGGKSNGNSGNKHRKHHARCATMPGKPGGLCARSFSKRQRESFDGGKCGCSQCVNEQHPPKAKVIYA